MKKLPLYTIGLFLLCSAIGFSYGQLKYDLDSLDKLISVQTDDTNKINSLLLLSKELLKTDPIKAKEYANQTHRISKNLNYIQGQIDAFSLKATAYKLTGIYDSSLLSVELAIQLSDSINDKKRLADNYLFYASMLVRTNQSKKGNLYMEKSFDLYQELTDSIGIADIYNLKGIAHRKNAQYDSTIFYYLQFIKLAEQIEYIEGLGKGYVNIGILYIRLGELEKAKNNLLESIRINKQLNNLRFIGIAYNNMGNIAEAEQDFDKALSYYNKSLKMYENLNNTLGIANMINNIANIHEKRKDYEKAFDMYTKAKELYEIIGDIDGIIASYKNQALIYERLKDYKKALIIYDSCLVLSGEIKSIERTKEIYYNIYRTYELMQDHANAFKFLLNYTHVKDSIFNIEKSKTIEDLQLKYETEKTQAQILTLEKENLEIDLSLRKRTNQRNIYLFSGSGIISIILFLLIFYRHKASKDRIIAEQKIQQLEEEKKLLAARSIVNGQEEERKRIAKELHDGLGVLLSTAKMQFTTIKDKSPENKPLIDKATKLLEQAAGDVRKISHNMMPGLLTKFGLYEAAEDLIEQVDETEGLNAVCEINGDTKRLPENTEIMLYRIIQEMVNNTLKHADAKNIQLQINTLPERLDIIYSDDGKGFDLAGKLETKSIGLSSIQSRVNFLSGQVNVVSKLGEGVKYTIEIPI